MPSFTKTFYSSPSTPAVSVNLWSLQQEAREKGIDIKLLDIDCVTIECNTAVLVQHKSAKKDVIDILPTEKTEAYWCRNNDGDLLFDIGTHGEERKLCFTRSYNGAITQHLMESSENEVVRQVPGQKDMIETDDNSSIVAFLKHKKYTVSSDGSKVMVHMDFIHKHQDEYQTFLAACQNGKEECSRIVLLPNYNGKDVIPIKLIFSSEDHEGAEQSGHAMTTLTDMLKTMGTSDPVSLDDDAVKLEGTTVESRSEPQERMDALDRFILGADATEDV